MDENGWAPEKTLFVRPADFIDCALNHSIFMWLQHEGDPTDRLYGAQRGFFRSRPYAGELYSRRFPQQPFLAYNLTEADFTGAVNYTIAANLNTLKKTKFSLPAAMSLLYSLDIELTEEE
jgi:hypothetical protein